MVRASAGIAIGSKIPSIVFQLRTITSTSLLLSDDSSIPLNLPSLKIETPRSRTKTLNEKKFETWIGRLKNGFTPIDVDIALRAQSDADLAFDIFRWTCQIRGYKHNSVTYLTMMKICVHGKRYKSAETLVEEVLSGACEASVPLYNAIIRFCCGRSKFINRAFDFYNKMLKSHDCKPNIETYSVLFAALLRRFTKRNVCYSYMHAVRSLTRQMKISGVIPDIFILNMIIKAYSKCLELDEAIKIFREFGLYGCCPDAYTYSYIIRGFCEKGRLNQALDLYKDMKAKNLVPSSNTYIILICSLAVERRLEDGVETLFEMLNHWMSPDMLTYKTLLEELCRAGRGNDALDLLEEIRTKDVSMAEDKHKTLLNGLHFLFQE